MAQVSYTGAPEEAPVAEPRGQFNLTVSPEAFGGGLAKGLQGLGAGLTQGAETYEEMKTDALINQNIAAAEQLQEEWGKLDPAERIQREQEYRDKIHGAMSQGTEGLPGFYQNKVLKETRAYEYRWLYGKMGTRAIEDTKQIYDQTNQATLDRLEREAATNPDDEAAVQAAADKAAQTGRKIGETKGLRGAQTDGYADAARAGVYAKVAEQLAAAAENDPRLAVRFRDFVAKHSVDLGAKAPGLTNKSNTLMYTYKGQLAGEILTNADPAARAEMIRKYRPILGDAFSQELLRQANSPEGAAPGTPRSVEENYSARRLWELEHPGQTPPSPSAVPDKRSELEMNDPRLKPNTYLAEQRERFRKELDENPELRLRAAAITSLENEGAGPGVIESLMNRMNLPSMRGGTLEQGMASGPNSFYGPGRIGLIERRMETLRHDKARFEQLNRLTDLALSGSNIVASHTDQGSAGDPNYRTGGIGVNINRERFNDWRGSPGGLEESRQFRLEQERKVAGG